MCSPPGVEEVRGEGGREEGMKGGGGDGWEKRGREGGREGE